ncbi:hypothetical protein DUNSADRAFT_11834 [Dunaliella salina]|uniref:Encoded protein n=1 Tax=Dunaliella salina TaxID=3046 RepID=A0ABQ7GCH0_DUNSA|nr:hypothetical protein DUNSADRAFT_11834 [Dunaliella salina]|eukprot:KAF5832297.1 hypothetical protein DUNSADRAFT_11834 [Dunaliella salina]
MQAHSAWHAAGRGTLVDRWRFLLAGKEALMQAGVEAPRSLSHTSEVGETSTSDTEEHEVQEVEEAPATTPRKASRQDNKCEADPDYAASEEEEEEGGCASG